MFVCLARSAAFPPGACMLQIPAEPHVLSMMLKQAVIVLKDCDPQGVSTIMSALAFLCNSRDPDARAVFCVAHAQLLRVLRTHMPRTRMDPPNTLLVLCECLCCPVSCRSET